jgi:hypothetical protein
MIYSLARINDFGVAPVRPRKWRLFAMACVRRVASLFRDERTHGLLQALDDVADGLLDHQAYRRLEYTVCDPPPYQDWVPDDDESSPLANANSSLSWACEERVEAYESYWAAYAAQEATGRPEVEKQAQAALLHELFGNPFRPATISPACRTPQVVALAQAAYDNRDLPSGTLDPARLAVLADALEEAGCDQADLLAHLRGPGPHVRGCWAVDLLLGKA